MPYLTIYSNKIIKDADTLNENTILQFLLVKVGKIQMFKTRKLNKSLEIFNVILPTH